MMDGIAGRVIEVGAGSGLNFQLYPPAVSEVIAVEPEPYLRARAEAAAGRAPVPVRVVRGVAERLPFGDAEFDAGVASLVLCSVRNQGAALAELYRVVKSGGELRFFEHVAAQHPALRTIQRALDATVWPRIAGGCHSARDTGAAIAAAGFEIIALRRASIKPMGIPTHVAPHIVGRARRP
jgi:ubiquinone/menaquinone biosynthesis C-methylase UbiE